MIDFGTFLAKVQPFADKDGTAAGPLGDTPVGVIAGKVVTGQAAEDYLTDIAETKSKFIDSVMATFSTPAGEAKLRSDVEAIVSPGDASKPLTARMVLDVNKLVGGDLGAVRRLSDILQKAALADSGNVSKGDVKKLLASIDMSGPNAKQLKALAKDVEARQKDAETAMKALAGLTGREIADAMNGGGGKAGKKIREAVAKAVNSMTILADDLTRLDRSVADEIPGLDQMRDRVLCRATELNRLVHDLADIGLELQPGEDGTVPNLDDAKKAKLEATAGKLLETASLGMHGTEEAIKAVEKELAPLLDRVEYVKSHVGDAQMQEYNARDIAAIRSEIAAARQAIDMLAQQGVASDDTVLVANPAPDGESRPPTYSSKTAQGHWRPNPTLFAEISKMLDKADKDLLEAVAEPARAAIKNLASEICPDRSKLGILSRQGEFFSKVEGYRETVEFIGKLDKVGKSLNKCAESSAYLKELEDACADVAAYARDNAKALNGFAAAIDVCCRLDAGEKLDRRDIAAMEDVLGPAMKSLGRSARREAVGLMKELLSTGYLRELGGASTVIASLPERYRSFERLSGKAAPRSLVNDRILLQAFEGKLDVATVAGMRAWGATEDMIDLNISEANLVEAKAVGSGSGGDLVLCRYRQPDGSEKSYLFKSEVAGELALQGAGGYGPLQSLAHLNAATRIAAGHLGVPDAISGSKVGCLHGRFGIFMEIPAGHSIREMAEHADRDYGNVGWSTVTGLMAKSPDDWRAFMGGLLRGTLDLEWIDWLTGQNGHDAGTSFFGAGDDGTVAVQGSHDETAFPSWRLGMTKFRLGGRQLEDFLEKVVARNGHMATIQGLRDYCAANGVNYVVEGEGKSVLIDVGDNFEFAAGLKQVLGIKTVAKPVAITDVMYRALCSLRADPEPFFRELARHVTKEAVEATRMRLNEMFEHLRELEEKSRDFVKSNRILDEDDWVKGGIWTSRKRNLLVDIISEEGQTLSDGRLSAEAQLVDCNLFARDFATFYSPDDAPGT